MSEVGRCCYALAGPRRPRRRHQPRQYRRGARRAVELARLSARDRRAAFAQSYPLLGKPDIEPTSPNDRIRPEAAFGSIHRTCLSALVADRATEDWYYLFIA